MTELFDQKLGDVLTFQRGHDITKKEQSPGQFPVISSGGASSTHVEYRYEGPGVVIGRKGSLGGVYWSEGPYWPHDTTLWVRDFKGNDPKYLYYFLKTLQLERFDAGASNPTLNRNHLHLLEVTVLPPNRQRSVADRLSAFDDLIENNHRRIEILEEMARLLYREWFVHFRFPGHEDVELVDSELGPIPEGWMVSPFASIVTEIKASVAETEIPSGSALVGLEHLPRRSTTLTEWDMAETVGSRRKVFEAGDILFGKIRPYFHKVVDAPIDGYSSTDAIVFRPSDYAERALCVASSDDFVSTAVATSNGTKMPRANTDLLLNYPIPEPPAHLATDFEELAAPMSAMRRNLSQQNRVLREARDLLLPRLVSGELDVAELELDGVLV